MELKGKLIGTLVSAAVIIIAVMTGYFAIPRHHDQTQVIHAPTTQTYRISIGDYIQDGNLTLGFGGNTSKQYVVTEQIQFPTETFPQPVYVNEGQQWTVKDDTADITLTLMSVTNNIATINVNVRTAAG